MVVDMERGLLNLDMEAMLAMVDTLVAPEEDSQ